MWTAVTANAGSKDDAIGKVSTVYETSAACERFACRQGYRGDKTGAGGKRGREGVAGEEGRAGSETTAVRESVTPRTGWTAYVSR